MPLEEAHVHRDAAGRRGHGQIDVRHRELEGVHRAQRQRHGRRPQRRHRLAQSGHLTQHEADGHQPPRGVGQGVEKLIELDASEGRQQRHRRQRRQRDPHDRPQAEPAEPLELGCGGAGDRRGPGPQLVEVDPGAPQVGPLAGRQRWVLDVGQHRGQPVGSRASHAADNAGCSPTASTVATSSWA